MKPKFPLLLAGLVLVLGVTGCQTAPEKSPMAQGLSP